MIRQVIIIINIIIIIGKNVIIMINEGDIS